MAPSRASRRTAPTPPPLSASLLLWTATLAALALATPANAHLNPRPGTTAAAAPTALTAAATIGPQGGVHVPLLRRNGHLRALARTPSRQDQHDIVAGWALREKDRLAVKYGLDARATTLKRRGEAESPKDDHDAVDNDDDNGTRRRRKGRRRVTGLQDVDTPEEDFSASDAWSIARRQLAGPNGGQLGTTVSSTTTTRTALSTAGYGTATRTSSGSSGSLNNATRTAPTTFPGPTQTVPVGDVHLLNYDADL